MSSVLHLVWTASKDGWAELSPRLLWGAFAVGAAGGWAAAALDWP